MQKKTSLTLAVKRLQKKMDAQKQGGRVRHFVELGRHLDEVLGRRQDDVMSPMQKYSQGQEMMHLCKIANSLR